MKSHSPSQSLTILLERYLLKYPEESATVKRFLELAKSGEILQGKDNLSRHVTVSSWILSQDYQKVLLTHHMKLGIWVQLGGHSEVGEPWLSGALREAQEESGLKNFEVLDPDLFDIDIHQIPSRPGQGAHWHYDLRFLIRADEDQELIISSESRDLRWVAVTELSHFSQEESQMRMARKHRHYIPST